VKDHVAEEIAELKQMPGNNMVIYGIKKLAKWK